MNMMEEKSRHINVQNNAIKIICLDKKKEFCDKFVFERVENDFWCLYRGAAYMA